MLSHPHFPGRDASTRASKRITQQKMAEGSLCVMVSRNLEDEYNGGHLIGRRRGYYYLPSLCSTPRHRPRASSQLAVVGRVSLRPDDDFVQSISSDAE